jgi:hypothetical protein
MTGYSLNPTTDEIEYVAPSSEPSHVHIPRPSRLLRGYTEDSARDVRADSTANCTCGDD